jgi:surface antigen
MIRPTSLALVGLALAACNPYTIGRDLPPRPEPRTPLFSPDAIEALATGFVAQRFPDLDGIDRRRAAEALVASLENGRPGQPNPFRNPASGAAGEVVPGARQGDCRDFRLTVTARTPGSVSAAACRAANGVWTVRG